MNKSDLRKKFSSLLPVDRGSASALLCRNLRLLPKELFKDGVFCFIPSGFEANIMPFINELSVSGIKTAVPVCADTPGLMDFYDYSPEIDMITGKFGIKTPSNPIKSNTESFSAMLLPAVAFAENGVRLGHGGGYYDRYIECLKTDLRKITLIGISFSCRIAETLPSFEHDEKADLIVTEKGVLYI